MAIRFERSKSKLIVLTSIILAEVFFGIWLWKKSDPRPFIGFLVRNQNEYIVAWKAGESNYATVTLASLGAADRFIRDELRLIHGSNPINDYAVEHTWVQDRFGAFVLMWKSAQFNWINQITFQNREEAEYFLSAFRKGAYTPSPFGHAVLLLPDMSPAK